MYARIVTFQLAGMAHEDYEEIATSVATSFTEWPGLAAKVWIADRETGTYGGLYLFVDREAADRSRETDVFQAMTQNPSFAALTVREFEVLEAPTAVTGPALLAR